MTTDGTPAPACTFRPAVIHPDHRKPRADPSRPQFHPGHRATKWPIIFFAVMLAIAFALPQPVSSTDLIRVIAVSNIVGFGTCWMSAHYLIHSRRPSDTY